MYRRALRSAATVGATATVLSFSTSYIYYRYFYTLKDSDFPSTFDLSVKTLGPDGKRALTTQKFNMISSAEAEARLKKNEHSQIVYRPGGIIWRHTTAQLASNDPIEDAFASAIVERDSSSPQSEDDNDLLFFAVMDGHAGPHTSRLLSKILIPAVSLQLRQLAEEPSSFIPKPGNNRFINSLWSFFTPTVAKPPTPYDADPKYVSLAIQTAFAMIDSELINAPLRIIADHVKDSKAKDPHPDLSQHPLALASMLPALSGSCALLALIDAARRDLYVACTGDCRAVAGVWEEDETGKGLWRVEVLSEDQTGRNPKELRRIQSEHPDDESGTVIQRGRVLGGLEPSRAFGDARYKWPIDLQGVLARVFMQGNKQPMRQAPPNLKTPPYVTAQPVITHRKLSLPSSQDESSTKSSLRFLVLATDGLWDELSSAEVVALVGGHLGGLSGAVTKKELSELVPTRISEEAKTVDGKDRSSRKNSTEGKWAFVDENVSTHLIRNAFGGADQYRLRKLLSIPSPLSRNYRDDVTVTVIWWEDGKAGSEYESFRIPKSGMKAKL